MQLCRQVWCWSFVYWRRFTVCKTITFIGRFKEMLWTYLICQKMLWESEVFVVSFFFSLNIVLFLCRIYTFIKLSQVPRQVKFSFLVRFLLLIIYLYSSFIRTLLLKFSHVYSSRVWFTSFIIILFHFPGVWSSSHYAFNLNCEFWESYI